MSKLGRNDPCHCGSGKKYKQCHLEKDETAEREARAKQAAEASAAEAEKPATAAPPKHKNPRPKTYANTRGFGRVNATRKVGGG